jgi:prophage DNA circulation protein
MRFKNYVWPHNPKTFEVTDVRRLTVNPVPFGRWTVTDMGCEARVLKGEGEFVGDDAYDEFMKLKAVFDEGTPGVLVHPVWQAVRVWFSALYLRQEPLQNFVSYAFEFVEDESRPLTSGAAVSTGSKSSQSGASRTYTVKKGDSLWRIAKMYNLTLNQIIKLNPQIKNPNLIYVGQTVYVA